MPQGVEPVTKPPEAQPSLLDQYEFGDEAPPVAQSVTPVAATATPTAPGEVAPPAAPRPRNPDGTFAPTPVSEPPALSPRLRRMAEDCGLSEDDIAGCTPAELEHTVYILNRRLREESRQEARVQSRDASRQPADESPGATVPQGTVDAGNAPAPSTFDLGLGDKESDFDPDLIRVIKGLGQQLQDTRRELQGHIQLLLGREVARENETNAERMDRAINAWDDARFGKGRGAELAKDGPEFGRRIAVLAEAQRLAGGPKAGMAKLLANLDKARTNLFGAASEAPRPTGERAPAAPSPEGPLEDAWREGGLAAPTNRSGAQEPAGRDRAIESVKRWQRENGEQREPEVLKEFPG